MNQPGGTPANSPDLNKSTIISGLYLASFMFGITGIVGVVLAYVWRGEVAGTWEESHFTYLIRTFWIGFILSVLSFPLMFVFVGFLLLPAAMVQLIVRCVFSIMRAQKHEPMPEPETMLW